MKEVLKRQSGPIPVLRLLEELRDSDFPALTQAAVEAELRYGGSNGWVREVPIPGRDGTGWMLTPTRRPLPIARRPVAESLADRLYPWQYKALREWERHHYRGIVEAVTGSGKTMVALAGWERLQAQHRRLNTLVVVPTVELMNQWHARFEAAFPGRTFGRVGGSHHDNFSTKLICVAVINSAVNHLDRLLAHVRRCQIETLLIADECHRYVEPVVFGRIRRFAFNYTLGLSATIDPFQVQGLGTVIYTYRFRDAVRDGLVPRFDIVNCRVALTHGERARYEELSEKLREQLSYVRQVFQSELEGVSGKAFWQRLQSLLSRPDGTQNPDIARLFGLVFKRAAISYTASRKLELARDLLVTLLNEGRRKAIVFFERIRTAEELQEELTNQPELDMRTATSLRDSVLSAGLNWCRVLHSGLARADRHAILDEFKDTKVAALVACRVLDEGLDVPEIDAALLVASTQSERQRIQRIGRSLRRGDGTKRPLVITLYVPETTEVNVTAGDGGLFGDAADIHDVGERECLRQVRALLERGAEPPNGRDSADMRR